MLHLLLFGNCNIIPLNDNLFGFTCIFDRTLMGIIDDYFDGYYSEEMIESQVCCLFKFVAMFISVFSLIFILENLQSVTG